MHTVYCYIDLKDDIVKYIGITSRKLISRINEHKRNEKWVSLSEWKIMYFNVKTKSESESWESHLIARYKTYNYYNTSKRDWGLIREFNNVYPRWETYSIKDIIVDINYNKYQILDNLDNNLIKESEILLECDINNDILLLLIAKKILYPLAVTSRNELIFWNDAIDITNNYLKQKVIA